MEHRACSRAGVIPWIGATFAQAQAACAGADLRLCSPTEWQAICTGATNDAFPYGVTYENTHCNGLDAGVGAPANTGTFPACTAEYPGGAVFDLSGNLKEWVDDGATSGYHQVRGGSYLSTELGLSCAFDFALSAANVTAPTVGFRCCASP
jgi:formylglycine-generating enzyme required for sulfatase activity